jgi:hypothetical protein
MSPACEPWLHSPYTTFHVSRLGADSPALQGLPLLRTQRSAKDTSLLSDGIRAFRNPETMKIINYPPDPAVESARLFVEAAFHTVDWDNFKEEIRVLEFHDMLAPDLIRDVRNFLHGTLRCLFWELMIGPIEYVEARVVLEAVCDIIDFIDAAFGPEHLEKLLPGRF